jgi:hypothetical protein
MWSRWTMTIQITTHDTGAVLYLVEQCPLTLGQSRRDADITDIIQ